MLTAAKLLACPGVYDSRPCTMFLGDCLPPGGVTDEVLDRIVRKLGIDDAHDVKDLVSFVEKSLIKGSGHELTGRIDLLASVKDTVGPSATALRKSPGTASISQGLFDSQKLLRGSSGNAGLVPKEIGDKLNGRHFNTFDDFREAFWLEVGILDMQLSLVATTFPRCGLGNRRLQLLVKISMEERDMNYIISSPLTKAARYMT